MKILAIDTSSKRCSVAILEDSNILINLYNDDEKTHSFKLMPMVEEAFQKTNLTLEDIQLLACCVGPGSFTGVRIGIATIKAFADVTNIPVVGISSLESLAYNVKEKVASSSLICSLIDAKNENVYCGLYYFENNTCNTVAILTESLDVIIFVIQEKFEAIKKLNPNIQDIIFVGDACQVYQNTLSSSFANAKFATEEENMQSGISVAKAGLRKYQDGEYGDSSSILPIYLRKSQAERAFEEKIKIMDMTMEGIETIAPNFQTEFDEFWNINNLRNDFANPNSKYFVAKIDDEIVGFAGILKICDEANIMNIATKVSKRHLGIGTKLLEALISSAKEMGCTSITLEVNDHNTVAINLYEKFNFKRIGIRKKYYNNTDDAIIMTLNEDRH